MKRWVTKTFGNLLKLLTEKMDKVDKKSKLAEEEEELKCLRMEKELQELKKGSNSDKRKCPPSTPTTSPRVDRIQVKAVAKPPARRVLISSYEEDDGDGELVHEGRGHLIKKFDDAKGKGEEKVSGNMTETKDVLRQLVPSLR
ncbi:hypothetical protein CBR_g12435 [Chara braunii]|uniref:Uncharacterized protein n=1 Tax=Chara braunii TaxID=69332 RepID=A0A388JSA8_CHABU|nr:hypothetical protein CBR_g12435 [Chara braunii]|eukprot:GBG60699.1 hypothetical protein CBR_g12435 [Chara braunii]